MSGFAVRGAMLHTPARDRLEALPDGLIVVGEDGMIARIGPATPEAMAALPGALPLVEIPAGQWLLPGLVDLHVHAPQWPQLGRALDVPLEQWLQVHTFPLEARFADPDYARGVYAELVDSLLAHGTTCAVYFATIHVEATVALAETCLARGQRALVGKVAMDDPGECPPYYRDADAAAALRDTRAVIERIRALQPGAHPLVLPAITPRFLPSCTEDLLAGLGRLAVETGVHVQTHCSESAWEVGHGSARFGRTDAEVLDDFGLLRAHGVLAHSTHLAPSDATLIRERNAAIAHCPLSNFYFAGEILPTRRLLDEGVSIGLGTDISGGYSPSMFESARQAVTASRILAGTAPGSALDAVEAFWLATAGGGAALGLPIGQFAPGFAFDAIVVDTLAPERLAEPERDPPAHVLESIVRRAGRAQVRDVWVAGRHVRS